MSFRIPSVIADHLERIVAQMEGRPCRITAFEPVGGGSINYAGKVSLDQREFFIKWIDYAFGSCCRYQLWLDDDLNGHKPSHHRVAVVCRIPVLDHVPRSGARVGGASRRGRYGVCGWTGHAGSDAPHPARNIWHGDYAVAFVPDGRVDDGLGQRSLQSALGTRVSSKIRVDGTGGSSGELRDRADNHRHYLGR